MQNRRLNNLCMSRRANDSMAVPRMLLRPSRCRLLTPSQLHLREEEGSLSMPVMHAKWSSGWPRLAVGYKSSRVLNKHHELFSTPISSRVLAIITTFGNSPGHRHDAVHRLCCGTPVHSGRRCSSPSEQRRINFDIDNEQQWLARYRSCWR